jgi:hypothetical protein
VLVLTTAASAGDLSHVADVATAATDGLRTIVVTVAPSVPDAASDHAKSLAAAFVVALPAPWRNVVKVGSPDPAGSQASPAALTAWVDSVAGLLG